MLIQDLRFIEETDGTDQIHGGVSAYTGVQVSAREGKASANAGASAYGDITGAKTLTATIAIKSGYATASGAGGGAAAYAVSLDGLSPKVAVSTSVGTAVSTGL
jgi:hypothetical protein